MQFTLLLYVSIIFQNLQTENDLPTLGGMSICYKCVYKFQLIFWPIQQKKKKHTAKLELPVLF